MRLRRLAPLLLLASASCAGWRQVSVAPDALADAPAEVRVTHADGTRLVLHDPRIAGDTLVGIARDTLYTIPLDSVRRLALPRASHSKTMAGTTFVAAALGAFVLLWVILIESN